MTSELNYRVRDAETLRNNLTRPAIKTYFFLVKVSEVVVDSSSSSTAPSLMSNDVARATKVVIIVAHH